MITSRIRSLNVILCSICKGFLTLVKHNDWTYIPTFITFQQLFEYRIVVEYQQHKNRVQTILLIFRELLRAWLPAALEEKLTNFLKSITNIGDWKCEQASIRKVHLIVVDR